MSLLLWMELQTLLKTLIDPRQAYGLLSDQIIEIIQGFRSLDKHVYFTAKLEKTTDEMGKIFYGPAMPGNKTAQALPYPFDEVLALREIKTKENKTDTFLMCKTDGLWLAKDRSGELDPWETPDLGAIIRKIKGESEE